MFNPSPLAHTQIPGSGLYFQEDSANFPLAIEIGEVVGVDPKRYVLKIKMSGGKILDDVSWLSPYSFFNGNGIYAMPQIGASVLFARYAEHAVVVLGFFSPVNSTEENRRNSRRLLNLGDICIQASDQCYFLQRRGAEYMTIHASPACYVNFVSGNNTIQGQTQRCRLSADGGVLSWDSDPETYNTSFSWIFRDKAKPDSNVAQITIGFHPTEDPEAQSAGIDKSIFSLIVKETVSSGDNVTSVPKFKLIIGTNGRIICSAESIKEVYRDFIDRYADSFIKDIANKLIHRESLTANIYDKAKTVAETKAQVIHHNKGS